MLTLQPLLCGPNWHPPYPAQTIICPLLVLEQLQGEIQRESNVIHNNILLHRKSALASFLFLFLCHRLHLHTTFHRTSLWKKILYAFLLGEFQIFMHRWDYFGLITNSDLQIGFAFLISLRYFQKQNLQKILNWTSQASLPSFRNDGQFTSLDSFTEKNAI